MNLVTFSGTGSAGTFSKQDDPFTQPGELFPEAFTKEFLLPNGGVQKRFSERCRAGKFTPIDLHALARTFGVSFQAMALRLEELRLLPRGSYDKIVQSGLRPQGLGKPEEVPSARRAPRLGLPDRYVAFAVSAYDEELLSETEFAEVLATDVATARAVYQQTHQRIQLDDGTQLARQLHRRRSAHRLSSRWPFVKS